MIYIYQFYASILIPLNSERKDLERKKKRSPGRPWEDRKSSKFSTGCVWRQRSSLRWRTMQKFHCILLLTRERSRQLQASELVLFGDKGLPRDRYVCTGNSIHTHNARQTSPFCTAPDGIHSQSQPGDGMLIRDWK